MVSLHFSVKNTVNTTGTLNLVSQGSKLLQYLEVKTLTECSDRVTFLLSFRLSEHFDHGCEGWSTNSWNQGEEG